MQFSGDQVTGQATTTFHFGDFGMAVPRTFLVLSMEDNVKLVLDFKLQCAR